MDQTLLRDSAGDLEKLLVIYSAVDAEAARLYGEKHLARAKSGRMTTPLEVGELPGSMYFNEGSLRKYRDLESAFAKFSIEATGGETPVLRALRAQKVRSRLNQSSNLRQMNMVEKEIVVLDIAGNCARVSCTSSDARASLLAMGFVREGDQLVRSVSGDLDRQKIVAGLIALRALFASGRDWSPAELVDLYREQGSILTGYRMISWRGPGQYSLVDR